ncbi:ATP-grasp domain-containing protein [Microbacterium sp. EST19A]|uniref:ATP-grasp domain-containing protein n=1 Tax=Microbacterium sp. EST19A TaxID=2862681 RepID=UPI001CBD8357|nr:ATP-grasp domain-containing protein [Microbacterium sp. EST19A]
MTPSRTVVLTGARAPVALDLARRFAEADWGVIVADSEPNLTARSRAVQRSYRVPSARFRPAEFARAVAGIARRHQSDLIVPTCEETFWLSAVLGSQHAVVGLEPDLTLLRDQLFAPASDVLARLHHKGEFAALLGELGLPHPRTEVISSAIEWRRRRAAASGRTSGARVVKPAFSRFGTRTVMLAGGEPLPDVDRITADQPWLIQERVTGRELCTYAVAIAGRLTAFVLYEPVSRAGHGAGVVFERIAESSPVHGAARSLAEALAAGVGLTGQFGLDLLHTDAGLTILECNPRATSGIHLFAPADRIAEAFRPATAELITASREVVRLGLPHLMYGPSGVRSVGDAADFVRRLEAPDVLREPGDRVALPTLTRSLIVQLRTARTARVSLLDASTHDIEWNGEPVRMPSAAFPPLWADAFVDAVARAGGTRAVAANVDAELSVVEIGDERLPMTVPSSISRRPSVRSAASDPQSYVVSPVTHYLHYAREEVGELRSRAARLAARGLLRCLGAALARTHVDDVAFVGNALVSTNLHPQVAEAELAALTAVLRSTHPHLAIGWRSVHGRGSLMPEMLRRCGYRLIPARSVLFTDTRGAAWAHVRDTVRDRAVYEKSAYRARPAVIDPATGMSSLPVRERIAQLYTQLYVDKYSRLNPRYSAAFIGAAQQSGLLEFTVLEHEVDARIDGVFGFRVADGFLAAPVLGYDTTLPQELGLYRMLSYLVARTAHENGVQLHNSSGVAEFKRNRGAESEFEYTAVYTGHLPWHRRAGWCLLETVVRTVAVPLVLREGL